MSDYFTINYVDRIEFKILPFVFYFRRFYMHEAARENTLEKETMTVFQTRDSVINIQSLDSNLNWSTLSGESSIPACNENETLRTKIVVGKLVHKVN